MGDVVTGEKVYLWDCKPGQRITVWSFPDPGASGMADYHEGTVEKIEDVGGFLSTKVTFSDGEPVYCRSYAQTRLVTA